MLSLLYGPALTSRYDYWKNYYFGYTELCQQNDISVFFKRKLSAEELILLNCDVGEDF